MKYNIFMKKLCIFLITILLSINLFFDLQKNKYENTCLAKEKKTTYAKAMENCTLYKTTTMSDDMENILFVIPETYFVNIIEEVSDNCLKVQYGNYVGYINSSNVIIATFVPIVKILENITCDIKESSGTQIWTTPSAESTVLTTIPAGTKNINYIAMCYGKIPNGGESNIWYYVNFTPSSNSTNVYEGYVYSENITNLTKIIANTETNPEVISNETNNKNYDIYISSPIRALIVSLIAIPVIILFLIITYKATRRINLKKEPETQVENSNNIFQYENNNYSNNNLHQEINNMRNKGFVRKINQNRTNQQKYPVFPTYDSEDDLL